MKINSFFITQRITGWMYLDKAVFITSKFRSSYQTLAGISPESRLYRTSEVTKNLSFNIAWLLQETLDVSSRPSNFTSTDTAQFCLGKNPVNCLLSINKIEGPPMRVLYCQ